MEHNRVVVVDLIRDLHLIGIDVIINNELNTVSIYYSDIRILGNVARRPLRVVVIKP